MSSGIDIVVGINDLFDLCRDTDELRFFFFFLNRDCSVIEVVVARFVVRAILI